VNEPGDHALEGYRGDAQLWLAANFRLRAADEPFYAPGAAHYTADYLARQRPLQQILHEGGYAGITWPREYGGQGLTPAHERVFREAAAAYALPDLGTLGGATYHVCFPTMLAHGQPEFLRVHGPRALAGDELWCQFFSEPGAGSDLAAVSTSARPCDEGWIISGAKVWTSGAALADYALCLARTDSAAEKHRGLTWFAVPTRAPGVTIRTIRQTDGTEQFCQETLDDVVVPDDHRIGGLNDGWTVTQTMLIFERDSGIFKDRVDLAPGDLPQALVRLARRLHLDTDPEVRDLIAQVHVYDYVQKQLASRVEAMVPSAVPAAAMAAYGKLAKGTFDPIKARIAMSIAGAAAVAWPPDDELGWQISKSYLNSRIFSIAGGTNEMQRNAIGERVLGLPRR
jgi:alkylation response protein AidB-like acyl-CoA dehydrogenase